MRQALLPNDLAYLQTRMSQFADALAGKTVLITGATGFFGKWLLESAISFNQTLHLEGDRRIKIVALSRNPGAFLERYPKFGKYDFIQYISGNLRILHLQ